MGNKKVLAVLGSVVFLFAATTAVENSSFAAAAPNKVTKQYKIVCKKGSRELINPLSAFCDKDKDGIPNKGEKRLKTNWKKQRTDGARLDGALDHNGNGIPDALEQKKIKCLDRDGDGVADATEIAMGIPPGKKDDVIPDGVSVDNGWSRSEVEDYLKCGTGNPSPTPIPGATASPGPTSIPGATATPKPTAPPGSTPTIKPTTPPGATATPTRTPTAKPSGGNSCDASGNTTGFGIPAGITGNKSRGSSIWKSSCQGCHGSSKRGSSYSKIFDSRNIPEMAGVKALLGVPQNSADLTADRNC